MTQEVTKLSITFFNLEMMNALGESEKVAIVLELTKEQSKLISDMKGFTILSIQPIVTP